MNKLIVAAIAFGMAGTAACSATPSRTTQAGQVKQQDPVGLENAKKDSGNILDEVTTTTAPSVAPAETLLAKFDRFFAGDPNLAGIAPAARRCAEDNLAPVLTTYELDQLLAADHTDSYYQLEVSAAKTTAAGCALSAPAPTPATRAAGAAKTVAPIATTTTMLAAPQPAAADTSPTCQVYAVSSAPGKGTTEALNLSAFLPRVMAHPSVAIAVRPTAGPGATATAGGPLAPLPNQTVDGHPRYGTWGGSVTVPADQPDGTTYTVVAAISDPGSPSTTTCSASFRTAPAAVAPPEPYAAR